MALILLRKYPILRLAPVFILFIALWGLVQSPVYQVNPGKFTLAVTADLLLIIPLLYFLLIRGTKIPRITVVPVMIGGLITGFMILPDSQQDYLVLFRDFVLPVIELSVAGFLIYQVRRTVQAFRKHKDAATDFYTALRTTLGRQLSGFALEAVCMEIAVIYYGFFAWKKPSYRENEYTIHRESGGTALWILILFLVAVETFVFHLLLTQWSVTAAWIFSGLSLYSGLQVLGIFKSLARRPVVLENGRLHLQYGLLNELVISGENIVSLERITGTAEEDVPSLSPLGQLEEKNMLITLREPQDMRGLYGLKKTITRLSFHIDEPERFMRDLTPGLASDS